MWPALEALLDEIDAATPGQLAREDGVLAPRIAAPGASAPLPVAVTVDAAGIGIAIEGWTQRFDRGDDDDDDDAEALALDLVAAALFGRLRVRVSRRPDGRVTARELVFATPKGPVVHHREQRWRWPWQGVQTRELANAIAVPKARKLGGGGLVPWAPWAGTLADTRAAPARAIAIDGELDLHPFSPKEVKPLVLEYIEVCKQRGIAELRIVHGKGIGALRRTVHALLADHPDVASYRIGGMGEGSWGATIVTLKLPVDGVS